MNRQDIEKKAHQTLVEHNLYGIPVDPVVIANRLGIRVSNAVFSDSSISGMIAARDGKKSILVNDGDSIERKRFTIAHELGHCILHIDCEGEFIDNVVDLFRSGENELDTENYYREIEANRFAAALLMDSDLVKETWEKYQDVDILARLFAVSGAAMGIRLHSMGLI